MCYNIQSADEKVSHQTNRLDRSDEEQFEIRYVEGDSSSASIGLNSYSKVLVLVFYYLML